MYWYTWHDFKLHCLVTITLESDINILVKSTRPISIYQGVHVYAYFYIAMFKQKLNSIHCWVCATGSEEEGSEVKSFIKIRTIFSSVLKTIWGVKMKTLAGLIHINNMTFEFFLSMEHNTYLGLPWTYMYLHRPTLDLHTYIGLPWTYTCTYIGLPWTYMYLHRPTLDLHVPT